ATDGYAGFRPSRPIAVDLGALRDPRLNERIAATEKARPDDRQDIPPTGEGSGCEEAACPPGGVSGRPDCEPSEGSGTEGCLACTTSDFSFDPVHGNVWTTGGLVPSSGVEAPVDWTYNVANPESSPFGFGWASSIFKSLVVTVYEGMGITYDVKTAGGAVRTYVNEVKPPGVDTEVTAGPGPGTYTEETVWGRQWKYVGGGQLETHTDRRGNVFTHNYDGSDRLQTISGPLSRVWSLSYDVNDCVEQITDPAGRDTLFDVDNNGDLVKVTTPGLCITEYGYDNEHRMTSVKTPDGYTRTFTYDGADQIETVTNPESGVTTFTYGGGGTSITDPLGYTRTTIHDDGSISAKIDPLGNRTTYTYASERLQAVTDATDATVAYAYDGAGRLTKVTDPLGKVTSYTHDDNNFLATVTNALGDTVTYSRDLGGFLGSSRERCIQGANGGDCRATVSDEAQMGGRGGW
ncbi:MAG TPA: hypothetical protein QGH10_05100, partial [Armatimonadota bacterium]|nr:hypothetical protein [Armatimonadota bacterium]